MRVIFLDIFKSIIFLFWIFIISQFSITSTLKKFNPNFNKIYSDFMEIFIKFYCISFVYNSIFKGWYIIKDKLETLLIQKILLIIQSYYQENQKETEKLINDLVMLFRLYGHNQSAEYIVAQRPEYPYTWETTMSYVKPLGMTDSQRKKIIQTLFDFSNNIYADFLTFVECLDKNNFQKEEIIQSILLEISKMLKNMSDCILENIPIKEIKDKGEMCNE